MLNALAKDIRYHNGEKGFTVEVENLGQKLLLGISEITEAQEELRDGKGVTEIYYTAGSVNVELNTKNGKPCGFPVELADAAIRLMDIAGRFEIDIETEAQAEDFEDRPIDDWLLGICNSISMAGYYGPDQADFAMYIKTALGTIFLLADKHNIKLMDIIKEKLDFNKTRPPKHGRQF